MKSIIGRELLRINARLDESHSRKLDYLKRVTGSGISKVIKRAIDTYYERVKTTKGDPAGLLHRAGFIGCAEEPTDLSEHYKEELAGMLVKKHDNR